MFSLEIRSHSYNTGNMPWVDHTGKNSIDKLVFSKKYDEQYVPGHYSIKSFGSLYRNIDNFCESPCQALSDWKITIPSIYSSKDGSFQTIDLFYHLEWINEKEDDNKKFNIVGCEAVLLEDGREIYKGIVDSISTSSGTTSISISESLGSPEIPKSDFPIALGNADMAYWPVKIAQNEIKRCEITISERQLERFDGFYMYLEKRNEFVPVSLNLPNQRFELSQDRAKATLWYPATEFNYSDRSYSPGEPLKIYSGWIPNLRSEAKDTPGNYLFGRDGIYELVQAWTNRTVSENPGSYSYQLGRDALENQVSFGNGSKIIKVNDLKSFEMEFCITLNPISLVFDDFERLPPYNSFPYASGDPAFFLETSKTGKNFTDHATGKTDWNAYPNITWENSCPHPVIIKFPKLDLPNSAYIHSFSAEYKIKHSECAADGSYGDCESRYGLFTAPYNSKDDFEIWHTRAYDRSYYVSGLPSISDMETMKVEIRSNEKISQLVFAGLRLLLNIRMPIGDAKLYASGKFANSDYENSDSQNSLLPAINGLLRLVGRDDYSAVPIGKINDIKYGSIVNNETVKFRDKLRNLAAESATLVKFSPASKELQTKSISRKFDSACDITLIPTATIALENNLYNFKLESPHRDDILSGLIISWGKNPETGKYEHILKVENSQILNDGIALKPQDYTLGNKWDSIFEQFRLNSLNNVRTVKSINSEWIMDWDGAELMAYNCLCWNCAPLRKAQVNCITPILNELTERPIDIGSFVRFELPGYPPKLALTTWVITGKQDDLDKMMSTIELLEAWGISAISPNRFLLLENGENILLETAEKIKLENLYV